jgi:catechol 2,3-dioxygenase-like lactoylglutathione lyase family enzyme
MPLGHLGINVTDLDEARRYYDQLMPVLGYEPFLRHDDEFAYRPANGKVGTYLFFYAAAEPTPYSAEATGLQHLAFMVPTRAAVDAALSVAEEAGSEVLHPPQDWPQYPPPYYAAFWHGPDGVMLEAVCHRNPRPPTGASA